MKVAISGATGVIGTAAVTALAAAGHDVRAMARTPAKAAALEAIGATAVPADLFDQDSLLRLFDGCDAVCNFATHIPAGLRATLPGAWRENDRLRTQGVRNVVDAARKAHVRRLVQESVSFLYADGGDTWLTEASPLDINLATEPASVGESHVADYQVGPRQGVVLRFGQIIGEDPLTRWWLRAARSGRPIGLGRPDGWAHVVHTDDLGPAVVAALAAPSGTYNVGAAPVRRADLVAGFAEAAGRPPGSFMSPRLQRLAGPRLEPLTRSLRVSSDHLTARSGWTPRRAAFASSWFDMLEEARACR